MDVDYNKIVTILQDKLFVQNQRSLLGTPEVQSIRVHPVNGYFFACFPLDEENGLILYPPNPNNSSYEEINLNSIQGYGNLDFPLDATWNVFDKKYCIADSGNNAVIIVDEQTGSIDKKIENFTLPHSILFNGNDKTMFIKSFTDENTQRVTQVNNLGDIIFEFDFPGFIDSTEISKTIEFMYSVPKYFTMDFDLTRNRLWFESGSVLYMLDLDNNQIVENDLLSGHLENISCVSIERGSGNAFVVIDDHVNYYVKQIFKDNNVDFGSAYLSS